MKHEIYCVYKNATELGAIRLLFFIKKSGKRMRVTFINNYIYIKYNKNIQHSSKNVKFTATGPPGFLLLKSPYYLY